MRERHRQPARVMSLVIHAQTLSHCSQNRHRICFICIHGSGATHTGQVRQTLRCVRARQEQRAHPRDDASIKHMQCMRALVLLAVLRGPPLVKLTVSRRFPGTMP